MADDLVAFLRAQLDEDEAAAQAAGGGEWHTGCEHGDDCPDYSSCKTVEGDDIMIYDEGGHSRAQASHIARHDPARVLREVKTWRKIILEYAIPPGTDAVYGGTERETGFRLALSFALKAKAAEWSDHPDYAPGP